MSLKILIEKFLTNGLISFVIKKFTNFNLNFLNINYNKISPKTSARIFFGFYERAEIKLIKKHIKNYLNVLEIGGGIGITAKYCFNYNKKIENYYIIEPYSINLELIKSQKFDFSKIKLIQGCVFNDNEETSTLNFEYTVPVLNKIDKSAILAKNISSEEVKILNEKYILDQLGDKKFLLIIDCEINPSIFISKNKKLFKNCYGIISELEEIEKYPIDEQIQLIENEKFILQEKLGRVCYFTRKD